MIASRDQTTTVLVDYGAMIVGWPQTRNRRWAHTSLRRGSAMHTMASTWVREPSFTMPPSHITGTAARWKRFLSQVSLTDTRCRSDQLGAMLYGVKKLFGARGRAWERTTTAY
jgi:hypothetical protein